MSPTSGASITVSFPSASTSGTATSSSSATIGSTTRISLAHSTVAHHAKDTVHLTVTRQDGARATGTVELYINGKAIKSYTLTKSDKGALKFSTPALTHAGSNRIRVTYKASGVAESAATKTVTVR